MLKKPRSPNYWDNIGIAYMSVMILVIGICIGISLFYFGPFTSDPIAQTEGSYTHMIELAKNISRDYDGWYSLNESTYFSCVNYTHVLKSTLDEEGYVTEFATGFNFTMVNGSLEKKGHRWLRVYIALDVEPQTGEIVNYQDEYDEVIYHTNAFDYIPYMVKQSAKYNKS